MSEAIMVKPVKNCVKNKLYTRQKFQRKYVMSKNINNNVLHRLGKKVQFAFYFSK